MEWDAVVLLRKNIKSITKNLTEQIKKEYPHRTTETKKCSRDMQFILQAISTCIQSNNTNAIDHVIKMYHLGGKLRLNSTYAELWAYNQLNIIIQTLFDNNNISNTTKEIVSNCIELLKIGITEEYTNYNTEWEHRRNYKEFDPTVEIPIDLQTRIEVILQNAPAQNSGDTRFTILKLLPSDLQIKEFLACNYFLNDISGYHEAAIVTCPIIYLIVPYVTDLPGNFTTRKLALANKFMNVGIHGGAVLNEVLLHGYDFSFIACTTESSSKEIQNQWRKICKNRWNIDVNEHFPWPINAFCIGRGIEPNEENSASTYTCLDGTTFNYYKTGPMINQRKENILVL